MAIDREDQGREQARELYRELSELRRRQGEGPEDQRRRGLSELLERRLRELPPATQATVLDELRALLVEEARGRQERLERAEARVRELETLATSSGAGARRGSSRGLAELGELLRTVVREQRPPSEEQLAAFGEQRVLAATLAAVIEALVDLEWLRLNLFSTMGVIPEGSGLIPKLTTDFGERLARCLAGDEEAFREFREKDVFKVRSNFVEVVKAWQEVAWEGTEQVLADLSIPAIRDLEQEGRREIVRRLRELNERLRELAEREPEANVGQYFLPLLRERLERKSLL